MNNKEKARELSKKFARQYHANNWPEWSDDEAFHYSNEEINNACIEMAQWKDEQFSKFLLWLDDFYVIRRFNDGEPMTYSELIDNFKSNSYEHNTTKTD